MKITEVVVTVRIPEGMTKDDLAEMISRHEILEWVPRDYLRYQGIEESGNAPYEKVVRVRFQDPT